MLFSAICLGFPVEKTGLTMGMESQKLLTGSVLLFNSIIDASEILFLFEEKLRTGSEPLEAAYSLQDDLDLIINDSGQGHILKGIYLNSFYNVKYYRGPISTAFWPKFLEVMLIGPLSILEKRVFFNHFRRFYQNSPKKATF